MRRAVAAGRTRWQAETKRRWMRVVSQAMAEALVRVMGEGGERWVRCGDEGDWGKR